MTPSEGSPIGNWRGLLWLQKILIRDFLERVVVVSAHACSKICFPLWVFKSQSLTVLSNISYNFCYYKVLTFSQILPIPYGSNIYVPT